MTEKEKSKSFKPTTEDVLATLKAKIKILREQLGYSQEDVSKLIGMSPSGFAKIEAGKNDITVTRLVQIANVLEISLTDLLDNQHKLTNTYQTHAQQIITGVVNGTNYGTIYPEETHGELIQELQNRLEKLESILHTDPKDD
jgi:transcriptional regulator with XRE-family HTH domain